MWLYYPNPTPPIRSCTGPPPRAFSGAPLSSQSHPNPSVYGVSFFNDLMVLYTPVPVLFLDRPRRGLWASAPVRRHCTSCAAPPLVRHKCRTLLRPRLRPDGGFSISPRPREREPLPAAPPQPPTQRLMAAPLKRCWVLDLLSSPQHTST